MYKDNWYKTKLIEMEKVKSLFSNTPLWKTFGITKGTFLNHIYRKVDITQHEMRDKEIVDVLIKIYNEYDGRIASKKILILLKVNNIKWSNSI